MAYKSILTILTEPGEANAVLGAAAPFAAAAGAHLDVLCLGIDRTQTGYYFAGATAVLHDETFMQAKTEAAEIETAAREILARHDLSWGVEALVVQSATVSGVTARHARFADLVILPKPYGEDKHADAPVVAEAVMFQGHAPVVILADKDGQLETPKKIVVAWNESAEAMAAIRRALPMLIAADEVNVMMIGPERHGADRADPGSDLSTMLARHGVEVEVSILPQTLSRVSDEIARHVTDQGADMLVMGAYGHSRFREAILGGATRNMLEKAEVPVFMAH